MDGGLPMGAFQRYQIVKTLTAVFEAITARVAQHKSGLDCTETVD